MRIRAKFRCDEEAKTMYGTRFKFTAVYDTDTPENLRFATATPSGEVSMLVTAPGIRFEVGSFYYLDFTPAE